MIGKRVWAPRRGLGTVIRWHMDTAAVRWDSRYAIFEYGSMPIGYVSAHSTDDLRVLS